MAVIAAAAVAAALPFNPDARAQQAAASPPRAGLKIVVIEGEGGVNIIQQKTAVAPVVEVRDRNDQPVSGAIVTFAIRNGRATFSGARTLTLTTNAAGRAVVTGLTPTSSGALQIGASAAFQGETAAATIVQTNVMTAAQAASAAGAGAGSAGGGGAGAGGGAAGGGGLSATTVGVVGGAVAGGALAATKVIGGGNGTTYEGQFSGPLTWTFAVCTRTEQMTGTLKMELEISDSGQASGTANVEGTNRVTAVNCVNGPQLNAGGPLGGGPATVTGTANALQFNWQQSNQFQDTPAVPVGVHTVTFSFAGTLSGGVITGTLTHTERADTPGFVPGTGSASYAVTLK